MNRNHTPDEVLAAIKRLTEPTRRELTYRLLREAGVPESELPDVQDCDLILRDKPINSSDLGYAICSTDPELIAAVEAWFNRKNILGQAVTVNDVRALMGVEV